MTTPLRDGPPRVSCSTWALHRVLGTTYWDTPENPTKQEVQTYGPGSVALLDVPARLAALGIRTMEVCHFHLPTRDAAYLADLRAAIDAAGVELWSLLIDAGDVTHPEHAERDRDWVAGWVETAGALGAKRTRVIAGKQPHAADTLARSAGAFMHLAGVAEAHGVRLMTENWFAFLSQPAHVHALLGALNGRVGLCLDFGNWDDHGDDAKYDDLTAIAPLAESCHAKSRFASPTEVEADDYGRCLELTRRAAFSGPYTLVYGGSGDDDWQGVAVQRDAVGRFLSHGSA